MKVDITGYWVLIRPSFLFLMNCKPEGQILGCEVGVDEGMNALVMLGYCPRLNLELVDIVKEPDILIECKERVRYHQRPSVEVAKDFPDEYFDYVYIDAIHEYDNVTEDIKAWFPKVKKGGILAGHDFWYTGVRNAVYEFFKASPLRVYGVMIMRNEEDEKGLPFDVPADIAEMSDWWVRK